MMGKLRRIIGAGLIAAGGAMGLSGGWIIRTCNWDWYVQTYGDWAWWAWYFSGCAGFGF
jgi:hypothetical protein